MMPDDIFKQLSEGHDWCKETTKKVLNGELPVSADAATAIVSMNMIVNTFWTVVLELQQKGCFDKEVKRNG